MEGSQPLVSIYVLTYNGAKTVMETLDSIKNLTYENIELVVSDDASKDDTVEICTKWMDANKERFDKVTMLTVKENTGVAMNFRRAIAACRAEWIKGVAGDDALCRGSIESFLNFVKLHPDARMVHAKCGLYETYLEEDHYIGDHGSIDDPLNRVSTAQQQFNILLSWPCIDAPTVFYHRSVFEMPELHDFGYPGLEDHPLFLRYTHLGNKIYFCDEVVCKYRQSPTSLQKTTNYDNLITKSYLQHFFDETKNYYKGFDKFANYAVNIYNLVLYKCKNVVLRAIWRYGMYPFYFLFEKFRVKFCYKRIEKALACEQKQLKS